MCSSGTPKELTVGRVGALTWKLSLCSQAVFVPVDDCGAIAGLLNDDDILSEVLEEDQNHCSDADTQDEPTRHRTVQKATEALAVLAELCICSRDSERPQHHHMG